MTTNVGFGYINNNAYIPQTNSGKEQPEKSATVQLGENTRTIAPGKTTKPVVSGNPNEPASTKSLESRKISAAGAAKAQQKPYNFTFKQLQAICNGKYNVGEVALDKKGQLTKINNHVHYSDKNTVVTTPEENARLRHQAYLCIADQFKGTKPGILADVHDILLGEGRESLSLSRDELGQLLKGIKDGRLELNSDGLKRDLENIRKFKMGDWPNAPWCSNADAFVGRKVADADFLIEHMKERGFIKGLVTDSENKVVSQISVNAKCDFVRTDVGGKLTNLDVDDWGMVSAAELLKLFFKSTMSKGEYDPDAKKLDNKLRIYKEDVRELANEVLKSLGKEKIQLQDFQKRFSEEMLKRLENFCQMRLERRNPAHANPGQLLVDNAQPNAKKTYVRQTFCHCDRDGKPTWFGSQFCFFNSVVNAVMAGSDSKSLERLKKMFTPTGFKLHDNDGVLHEYTYDDSPDLPKNGNFSVYEESLNKHFKLLKGPQYNYGAGGTPEAAKALGMQEVDQPAQIAYGFPMDELGEITDPAKLKQLQQNCVDELAGHLKSGKFVTYNEKGHFVAVTGIELQKDGSVKLSIVDDRANVNDAYEYDKTYTAAQFKALCQEVSFSVLEWKPEKENV